MTEKPHEPAIAVPSDDKIELPTRPDFRHEMRRVALEKCDALARMNIPSILQCIEEQSRKGRLSCRMDHTRLFLDNTNDMDVIGTVMRIMAKYLQDEYHVSTLVLLCNRNSFFNTRPVYSLHIQWT